MQVRMGVLYRFVRRARQTKFLERRWFLYLMFGLPAFSSIAQQPSPGRSAQFDAISVTATREARTTKEVPQSISVVDEKRIGDVRMFNIKDAIQGQVPGLRIESNNNAYDAKISIRGAGLKAAFGVREINLLRDGVPILDPDSFGRLDFVDPDDVERIEVTRGPGDLYSAGTAGGTIHIISRSAFDDRHNVIAVAWVTWVHIACIPVLARFLVSMRLLSLFHAVTPIMTGGGITVFQAPTQDSNMAGNWENQLCLKAR